MVPSRYAFRLIQTSTVVAFLAVAAWAAGEEINVVVAPSVPHNRRNSEGTILELDDGRLLLAWADYYGPAEQQGDDSPARISAAVSHDQGRTWDPRFTLQENIGGRNVMCPSLLRLKSGKILLFFLQKNSNDECFPLLRVSTDGAKTFSPPRPVPMALNPAYIAYMGFNNDRVIQLASGRILVPMFAEKAGASPRNVECLSRVYYSDDDGDSWKPSETIVDVKESRIGAQEPGVVELKDGRVMMWLRTSTGKIHACYSADSGKTWGDTEPLGVTAPISPASIKRIPTTGDLLMVWNNSPGERFPLITGISKDDGRSWQHLKNLDDDPRYTYAYTSINFVGDRALFTYYTNVGRVGANWSLKFKSVPVASLYAE
jgi:predicted neuraminidase